MSEGREEEYLTRTLCEMRKIPRRTIGLGFILGVSVPAMTESVSDDSASKLWVMRFGSWFSCKGLKDPKLQNGDGKGGRQEVQNYIKCARYFSDRWIVVKMFNLLTGTLTVWCGTRLFVQLFDEPNARAGCLPRKRRRKCAIFLNVDSRWAYW